MAWEPGQSGNPGGRPKTKPWKDALERAMAKLDAGEPVGTTLTRIAERCAAQALEGDKDARREIAERFDGKVPQALVGDDDHPPLAVSLIELVAPGAESSD